jgi:hypothetical protein
MLGAQNFIEMPILTQAENLTPHQFSGTMVGAFSEFISGIVPQ